MSRSGYSDDCEHLELYRANVDRTIGGKRGQAFLKELAAALDAMPVKELITEELITVDGACCAMGAVCKQRQMDVSRIDYEDPERVGKALGISRIMAAEIAYENDEYEPSRRAGAETREARWQRMRKWVSDNLVAESNDEMTSTHH